MLSRGLMSSSRVAGKCLAARNRVVFRRFNSTEDRRNKLLESLTSNQELRTTFEEFGKLVQAKGFTGEIGALQQMKFLMDKEIRAGLKKISEDLAKAGVEIKPEDAQALTDLIRNNK